MTKAIAKMTEQTMMLLRPGESLHYYKPSLVTMDETIEMRALQGKIKILALGIDDEATNAEFQKFFEDSGDEQLAAESFVSKFGGKVTEQKPEEKKKEETEGDKEIKAVTGTATSTAVKK